MSPSYSQSEVPSPSALAGSQQQQQQPPQYIMQTGGQQQRQAQTGPAGPSPPHTPSPCTPTPSTMMGQLMGALNNTTLLDDLNINIESLHGGFDCNVEEVRRFQPLIWIRLQCLSFTRIFAFCILNTLETSKRLNGFWSMKCLSIRFD